MLRFQENTILGDVYGPSISQGLLEMIGKPGRTVLFLDGGDKPHEFNLFVPALKPGDIVAVHDWGRCIKHKWVEDTIAAYNLEPLLMGDNVRHDTMTAMFKRRE
jgi:hypothetical protein